MTNLPPVGRGGKIEAKFVVGEGAGHGLWKKVEAEKEGFKRRKEEEDTLRELFCVLVSEVLAICLGLVAIVWDRLGGADGVALYTAQGDSVLDVGPPARPPSP